jgi:hypothetical protein
MAKRKKPGSPENSAANGDYVVGKGRPPVQSRWKPGQSGNPKGRPKGHRNVRSELVEIASQKVTVRDGNAERRLSLLAANFYAHAVKGAKGDARSSSLVFNLAEKMKVVPPEESYGIETVNAAAGAAKSRPTDGLFENLDLTLLSREEQAELSRLAELIDLGADLTGLERLKYLVEKGRGSSITETSFPQQPEN